MNARPPGAPKLLAVFAALAFGLALGACAKPAPPPQGPPEVGVVVLTAQPANIETELPGRTSAFETSEVRPQVNGLIQARLFTEGSLVRQGELLYQIDPAPYRAALAQAEAQVANARAAHLTAQLKADRYATLLKSGFISRQDADDAAAVAAQTAAQIRQNEAAVQTARINLGYTRVPAPIAGRIGKSTVTRGALVTASQPTALTTIQRMDPVYVDISQSSAQLLALEREIQAGKLDRGGVAVRLKLEDGSDYDQTGRLEFSDVTVDQNTGTVTLRAVFPNPRGVLLPGMYVRAIVSEGVQPNAILAPQVGVTRDQRGLPTALVVNAQGRAELRTLKTGPAVGAFWVVTSGLAAGDRLIVEGLQKVKPGQPVRAVAAGAPPTPPPTPPSAPSGAR
jgi:membrane fusion protein (multidrug efflux system)